MLSLPLVSVIIPVYNVAKFLRESLDSAVNQTYKNLEIILVDDGSTDGSEIICDEYAGLDSRIKVIHQKNKGLSEARNTGLDIMTGSIVSFLDSDDVFYPDNIRRMVETMLTTNADVVTCRHENYVTEDRLDSETVKPSSSSYLPKKKLIQGGGNRFDSSPQ